MDKETIVALTLGRGNRTGLIMDYCLEMGKEEPNVSKFIAYLLDNLYLHDWCFLYALEYYQRKFNICILYSKEGRIITAY